MELYNMTIGTLLNNNSLVNGVSALIHLQNPRQHMFVTTKTDIVDEKMETLFVEDDIMLLTELENALEDVCFVELVLEDIDGLQENS